MTRMHATHFCHHGARRFESQSNASTILCSRWLPNGTHSGRGDAARQLLPFSDVVVSSCAHVPQEDFSHNELLRRYYARGGLPMVHIVPSSESPSTVRDAMASLSASGCTLPFQCIPCAHESALYGSCCSCLFRIVHVEDVELWAGWASAKGTTL